VCLQVGLEREKLSKCWYRLVVTANAMAIMCIEKNDFVTARSILESARQWALEENLVLKKNVCQVNNAPAVKFVLVVTKTVPLQELRAYVLDTYAYLFYQRKMSMAALEMSRKAIAIYERLGNTEGAAIGLLNISTLECQIGKFKDSHKVRVRCCKDNKEDGTLTDYLCVSVYVSDVVSVSGDGGGRSVRAGVCVGEAAVQRGRGLPQPRVPAVEAAGQRPGLQELAERSQDRAPVSVREQSLAAHVPAHTRDVSRGRAVPAQSAHRHQRLPEAGHCRAGH
jgi:hypothetical protein